MNTVVRACYARKTFEDKEGKTISLCASRNISFLRDQIYYRRRSVPPLKYTQGVAELQSIKQTKSNLFTA